MTIAHPDISTDWLRGVLTGDATLMAMQVTINGTPQTLKGVFYMRVPQELEISEAYPCVIVNQPISNALALLKKPNGPLVASAGFLQDVRVAARDVEPDSAEMRAIRARIIELLEGGFGVVAGGRVGACAIDRFLPDQRFDRGGYVYSEIGVTFVLDSQLT